MTFCSIADQKNRLIGFQTPPPSSLISTTAIDQESSTQSESGMNLPKNINSLTEADLSQVPKTPVRSVGSCTCPDATCDGSDNDKCFESCGNKAFPTDIYGCPKAHEWALSFDDGPSNVTGKLLDSLDHLNIKATFCVLGSNVKSIDEGEGYKILLWNVDPTDYDVHSLPNAADKIQGAFKAAANSIDTGLNSHDEPGYISLLHENLYKSSIEQVLDVIDFLSKKGYNFKTAAECIGDKIPHALVFPKAE
ncbi:hypothetical protein BCR42DRAFT_442998 [Absidia repens]|uniref:NodB homology domain-containing protein n=1 Tax=Absidia repens TaxID=90262 RepID=A0A1X2I2A7_9FUNG|nr:hypothetical protein BCR42DRAFT_442998 [Absidia repens]